MAIIRIEDLLLRPIRKGDASRLAVLVNDQTLALNTARIPYPYTRADADDFVARSIREYESGQEYRYVVCRGDEIIACTGVMPAGAGEYELGYWVGAKYRGRGVAKKAACAVCYFAFECLDAKAVLAGRFFDNPASEAVLYAVGFQKTDETIQTYSLARNCSVETMRYRLEPLWLQLPGKIAIHRPLS